MKLGKIFALRIYTFSTSSFLRLEWRSGRGVKPKRYVGKLSQNFVD